MLAKSKTAPKPVVDEQSIGSRTSPAEALTVMAERSACASRGWSPDIALTVSYGVTGPSQSFPCPEHSKGRAGRITNRQEVTEENGRAVVVPERRVTGYRQSPEWPTPHVGEGRRRPRKAHDVFDFLARG